MTRREGAFLGLALLGVLLVRCEVQPVVRPPVVTEPVSGRIVPMGGVNLRPRASGGVTNTPTPAEATATPTPAATATPAPADLAQPAASGSSSGD
jgi:hypothetical protein